LPEEEYRERRRWFDEVRSGLLYLEEDDSALAVRSGLLYLEEDDSALALQLTAELIKDRFPAGSFPQLLLSRLAEKNDPAALQLAYRLIDEVKR